MEKTRRQTEERRLSLDREVFCVQVITCDYKRDRMTNDRYKRHIRKGGKQQRERQRKTINED